MAKTLDAAGVKRLIQEIKGANKNLNAPIPISTDNTTESMAQNAKNIADYVEKAKAAGIADVNGMAVTCIIDDGFSGVGYLYGNTDIIVSGIITFDDGTEPYYFLIQSDGFYSENIILMGNSQSRVTSSMLVEGARKPIILTPETTEVDEETYQKLLSDDVDVVFKSDGNLCTLTFKLKPSLSLVFTGLSLEGDTTDDLWFYGYEVSITKDSPHNCTINQWYNDTLSTFLGLSSFIDKSTLTPVLQEIDLTGTDADRKAKLDQFEADWKALTGADDLTGARFVGRFVVTEDIERNVTGIMTYCAGDDAGEKNDNCFYGICNGYSFSKQKSQIAVKVSCKNGSITITPLFSHLEAITIYTDNTPEHMQANLDNIAAYEANLQALGVDVTKGWNAPVAFSNGDAGILSYLVGDYYLGIQFNNNNVTSPYSFNIRKSNGYFYRTNIITQATTISSLTTTSKQIVGAINEINANAVHSDKLVPTLEAITIKTGNTPDDKAANIAAIKAYVDNLIVLGVDVTKGYMIPFYKYDTNAYGILVGNGTTPRLQGYLNGDNTVYAYVVGKDGTVSEGLIQLKVDAELTTTTKAVVPAINEVNALAKGYSTIFTPIELTTETAQNKTAIDARVAAFTAQGISLANGCCIPVTYKGVYAGNISLINGDWYGLLVKNTNNPADNINIKLSADGTITEGNSAQ